MITLKKFVFNELAVNAFVLHDESGDCIIIDPGCNTPYQQKELQEYIEERQLKPRYIVNTHGHFDHIFGNAWAKEVFGCPLMIHEQDAPLMEHADKYAGIFGFSIGRQPHPDGYLEEGTQLEFGHSFLRIIHVPGHSPGSICLYSEPDHFLVCGDVLFNGSIGRTDLFGGDFEQLITGIREKLMILPPETRVWPGHGPETTIGNEHDSNPFLNE